MIGCQYHSNLNKMFIKNSQNLVKRLSSLTWLTQATVLSYTSLFILMPTMALIVNILIALGFPFIDNDLWLLTIGQNLPLSIQKNLIQWWHEVLGAVATSSIWIIVMLGVSQWMMSLLVQYTLQKIWKQPNKPWETYKNIFLSLFWTAWALILQVFILLSTWIVTWIESNLSSIFNIMIIYALHFSSIWLIFTCAIALSSPIKWPKNLFTTSFFMSIAFLFVNIIVKWVMENSFTFSITFGSFSFIPMLMVWLECVWAILILGVMVLACYNNSLSSSA